jgi:hypothetical protein
LSARDELPADLLESFRDAAQSLKLYRRAELTDASGSLIEELYVDPLPRNHVLETTLKSNTTFLIGRKGTGKSTVFQRAQHELRSSKDTLSAYVDIKTVFESSHVDQDLAAKLVATGTALPPEALQKLLLYRGFLDAVISEIRTEMSKRMQQTFWSRVKGSLNKSLDELFERLDEVLDDARSDRFINVVALREERLHMTDRSENTASEKDGLAAQLSTNPSVSVSAEIASSATVAAEHERAYADILMRAFDMKEYVLSLKEVLDEAGIKHLYVFVDDFSELPEPAMKLVVDALLAPLNNWSDELVKFKIAAYPGRIYYGAIDKTKIDEINLDLYSLYGTSDIADMEEKAIDFTRRIIDKRLEHFCKCGADTFLDVRTEEDLWRQLFYATMANPRNLGYVLFFLYESSLLYGQKITLRSLRDAARRYYEEKIEAYFGMNRFLHETFDERSSIYSLKELLDNLVERARELRSHQGSAMLRDVPGRPPTSHFHVAAELENLLTTLELNFFLTKYYVMSDRDGRKVTVYALNYGLCNKFAIEFGRPSGRREYRLYYVERIFDYTSILQQYLFTNQEIVCDNCIKRYEHDQLEALALFGMLCPECKIGTCVVTNLSKKYEPMLRAIDEELLLPRVELGILHALGTEKRPLFAAEIAGELDCSYQLVGRRGRFLADRGLVHRSENESGRREFSITDTARSVYLDDVVEDAEQVDP